MDTRALQHAIADTWFGEGMSPRSLERLADVAREYHAPGRTKLLREGHETSELGIVRRGRVALSEHVPGRGSLTLMTVEAGDVFGWSAIVPPYTAITSVISVEAVDVIALDGTRLRTTMAADPELTAAVGGKVLQALGRRLRATRHQLIDLHGDGWSRPAVESP